jgi:hypothetical protein
MGTATHKEPIKSKAQTEGEATKTQAGADVEVATTAQAEAEAAVKAQVEPEAYAEAQTAADVQAETEEKKTVSLRHKTPYRSYRRAGLVLTQAPREYTVTEDQLAALKADTGVEVLAR